MGVRSVDLHLPPPTRVSRGRIRRFIAPLRRSSLRRSRSRRLVDFPIASSGQTISVLQIIPGRGTRVLNPPASSLDYLPCLCTNLVSSLNSMQIEVISFVSSRYVQARSISQHRVPKVDAQGKVSGDLIQSSVMLSNGVYWVEVSAERFHREYDAHSHSHTLKHLNCTGRRAPSSRSPSRCTNEEVLSILR